jgi:WD40 repeat protein
MRLGVREIGTGKEIATLPGDDSNVWAIDFTPDSNRLLSASRKSLRLWDLKEQKIISQAQAEAGQRICGWEYGPQNIRFGVAPAESQADQPKIIFLDANQHTRQTIIGFNCNLLAPLNETQAAMFQQVMSTALYSEMRSANGRVQSVTVPANGGLFLMDTVTGLGPVANDQKFVTAALSPDGRQAAAASADGNISIWDLQHLTRIVGVATHHDSPLSITFTADGQQLLVSFSDGHVIRLIRGSAIELERVGDDEAFLEAMNKRFFPVCGSFTGSLFAQDGDLLRSLSFDGESPILHEVHNGSSANAQVFPGHTDFLIRDISLSTDGSRVLMALQPKDRPAWKQVATYDARTIKLTNEQQAEIGEGKDCVRLSSNGSRLAIVDRARVLLANAKTGQAVHESTVAGNAEIRYLAAIFSPDGMRVATYASDGQLVLADAETGVSVDAIRLDNPISQGPIYFAFDHDGRHVLIGSGPYRYSWFVFRSTKELTDAVRIDAPSCIAPNERRDFSLPDEPPDWCVALHKPPYDRGPWQKWLLDKTIGKVSQLPLSAR